MIHESATHSRRANPRRPLIRLAFGEPPSPARGEGCAREAPDATRQQFEDWIEWRRHVLGGLAAWRGDGAPFVFLFPQLLKGKMLGGKRVS
jgi:hypothetical protein